MRKRPSENSAMRILTALGIIFIVCGHLSNEIFTVGGLFPYYSFHVFIFLFVSGYFYDSKSEDHPLEYIFHKIKTLLVPYFVYNLIYGIISTALDYKGIYLGSGISLRNLFLEPFLGGHQFGLNSPAWFVPALFAVLLINLLGRKIVYSVLSIGVKKKCRGITDIIMTVGSLAIGILTIYLAIGGHVYDYWKTPGRFLIMLPGVQFGICYREYIEGWLRKLKEKIGDIKYYVILLILILVPQYFMSFRMGNLSFGVVWCSNFANGPFVPYITVITGISFWLLISKILASISEKTNCLNWLLWVGRSSYHIMTNHFLVLLLINSLCMLFQNGFGVDLAFNFESFAHDFTYQCLYAGYHGTRLINVFLCVLLPTLVYKVVSQKITQKDKDVVK